MAGAGHAPPSAATSRVSEKIPTQIYRESAINGPGFNLQQIAVTNIRSVIDTCSRTHRVLVSASRQSAATRQGQVICTDQQISALFMGSSGTHVICWTSKTGSIAYLGGHFVVTLGPSLYHYFIFIVVLFLYPYDLDDGWS